MQWSNDEVIGLQEAREGVLAAVGVSAFKAQTQLMGARYVVPPSRV
jgi:hypothetical protein